MLVIDSERIRARTSIPQLIEKLREVFRGECDATSRQVVSVPGGERVLLAMPAFDNEGAGIVKLATVFADNPSRGLPTIQAVIVVFSSTGAPVALLEGTVVTKLRTGAASALASTYLSRSESSHLTLIGTGALAPYMAMAHCAVRPITRISVWGRVPERASSAAAAIRVLVDRDVEVRVPRSLQEAVTTADIVCCATSAATPVLQGVWLRSGTFVDLVGSFSPSRREADDAAITRSRIFVDTLEGALAEAGDILDPLARGVIDRERIEGELADLVTGRASGRADPEEITLFKSVGCAIEDLVAARLIMDAEPACHRTSAKRDAR